MCVCRCVFVSDLCVCKNVSVSVWARAVFESVSVNVSERESAREEEAISYWSGHVSATPM